MNRVHRLLHQLVPSSHSQCFHPNSVSKLMCQQVRSGHENSFKKADYYRPYKISQISSETHDSYRYRVQIPNINSFKFDATSSCCVKFVSLPQEISSKGNMTTTIAQADTEGMLQRSYTPVNDSNDIARTNELEFIIKLYSDGEMSSVLRELNIGDTIWIRDPKIKIKYPFAANKSQIVMIAGGTGIAPMVQILKEICLDLTNKNDNANDKNDGGSNIESIDLIYGNVTEKDVLLCKKDLDYISNIMSNEKIAKNIKYQWINLVENRLIDNENVSSVDNTSTGNSIELTGRVSEEMLSQYMPQPSENVLVLVCGKRQMLEAICGDTMKDPQTKKKIQGPIKGYLKNLGYSNDMIYKF